MRAGSRSEGGGPNGSSRSAARRGQCSPPAPGRLTFGCGSKFNQEGLRRCWSMFPLTRVPFWYRVFEPPPLSSLVFLSPAKPVEMSASRSNSEDSGGKSRANGLLERSRFLFCICSGVNIASLDPQKNKYEDKSQGPAVEWQALKLSAAFFLLSSRPSQFELRHCPSGFRETLR